MHHRHDIDIQAELELTRRSFFNTAASGVGGIALASLLQQDGPVSYTHLTLPTNREL